MDEKPWWRDVAIQYAKWLATVLAFALATLLGRWLGEPVPQPPVTLIVQPGVPGEPVKVTPVFPASEVRK